MTDREPADESDHASRHRAVRSYVIRAGRSTAGQDRALAELWPRFGIERTADRFDFDTLFARQAPRLLEIGFGAGESLLHFAKAHPHIDCVGIEVHPPGIGHLLLGIEAEQLTNVRIINADAVEVLHQNIEPASFDFAHLFFPDPWPKKRHHKRRIVQPAFASLIAGVLKPDGRFRLATDWEHYAMHMLEVMDAHPQFLNAAGAERFMPRTDVRPLTRFERRGQRLGHGVWDLEYRLR